MAVLTLSSPSTARLSRSWAAAFEGARDMASVIVALTPLGLLAGAHVAESPVRNDIGLIGGMMMFGASGHITAVSLIGAGAGVAAVVAAVLVINARGLVFSAALSARLQAEPAWFRWAAPYLLVDPLFALVSRRGDSHGVDGLRGYYLGAGLSLWTAWFFVMLAGVLVGPSLPEAPCLEFAVPAAFAAFLMPGLRDRGAVVAAGVGAVVGAFALGLPGGYGLLIAAAAGTVAGPLAGRMFR